MGAYRWVRAIVLACACVRMCACLCACVLACVHACVCECVRVCVCARARSPVCVCARARARLCVSVLRIVSTDKTLHFINTLIIIISIIKAPTHEHFGLYSGGGPS